MKFMQIGAALGGAALVAVAGSAYTATGMEGMAPYAYWGQDSTLVEGVTVSDVAYTTTGDPAAILTVVTFTVGEDLTTGEGFNATLTPTGLTDPQPATCNTSVPLTITCTETAASDWALDDLDGITLTVVPA